MEREEGRHHRRKKGARQKSGLLCKYGVDRLALFRRRGVCGKVKEEGASWLDRGWVLEGSGGGF